MPILALPAHGDIVQRIEDAVELAPARRQPIGDRRRHRRLVMTIDDAGRLERPQPLGQDLGRDAGDLTLQLAEANRPAIPKNPQDIGRPGSHEQPKDGVHRTAGWVTAAHDRLQKLSLVVTFRYLLFFYNLVTNIHQTSPAPPRRVFMARIVIAYHSGYGHTAVQAEAVARGARSVPGAAVQLVKVEDAEQHWPDLAAADAIIFGAPTYMGSASAAFKTFMDASSKPWSTQAWKDKIAAGCTNSASQSGDKLSTLQQLAVFAAQHAMVWVGLGLMPGNNSSKGSTEDLNRLGSFLGAMAQSNADQGPEHGPTAADQRTAEHLGRRVAETALRWQRGHLDAVAAA